MLIPLILAAFTHLWNIDEFPLYHPDEGHYMRRIFVVLNGIGLLEKSGFYTNAYDHPFFGQLLVGNLMRLSGYPNFAMENTMSSIELTMAFPRMIMGIFAIIDTFLIFKIGQRIYNLRIGFFASILFAVTPMTWLLRMTTLDAIALPFLLASILISLNLASWNKNRNIHQHIFLVLLSGTFLGLSILTKIPLITMIPLFGYLIYKNSTHLNNWFSLKMIFVGLVPVVLIASSWPLHAIYLDQFDSWKNDVFNQVNRERREIIESFFNIDWLLLFLGLSGLVYSFLKKDWILILWILPFLIFVYVHGWFVQFHWIIVFPAFCIAGAKFVIELTKRIKIKQTRHPILLIVICTIIGGVGFFNTIAIINQNLQSAAIESISKSLDNLDTEDGRADGHFDEKITIIAPTEYSWIFKYVHGLNYTFDSHRDLGLKKIETNKTLMLEHPALNNTFEQIKEKFSTFILNMSQPAKLCYIDIVWPKSGYSSQSGLKLIPYRIYDTPSNKTFEARNDNGTNNVERIDVKNINAKYINITTFQNSHKTIAPISDIAIYGKVKDSDACKKIPISNIRFKDRTLFFNSLNDFQIIDSYQKLINEIKVVSKYSPPDTRLNPVTEFFSPFNYYPNTFQLKTNF